MSSPLPLALSLSSSFTEVGAIAAFAALLGIAILSLLVFSQAREIKRLREWAGRAPERAAEMEQRVSANAAARARGVGTTPAGAPPPGRVVPRKTPLVSAPVSTAVNATVAAVVPVAAGSSAQAAQATPHAEQHTSATASSDAPVGSEQGQHPAVVAQKAVEPDAGGVEAGGVEAGGTKEVSATEVSVEQAPAIGEVPATTPATAAARAAGVTARSPLPPSPAAPAPPAAPSSAALAGASTPPAQASEPDSGSSAAVATSRPPAPVASPRPRAAVAARSGNPSRAVGSSEPEASPRSASPPRALSTGVAATAGARAASARSSSGVGGPKYFKPERSTRRMTMLVVGGAIVGLVVIVLAVSALKSGGGSTPAATHSPPAVETEPVGSSHKATHVAVVKPGETAVAVLNGTSTAGLAHHLAADLQQSGYTRAVALAGVPPGTHATTVVEYARGHRAGAQAVAKTLNVTHLQALDPTIASLAGAATVVVLAGVDQAAQLGGGGAQSNGEPAAGAPAGQ